MCLVRCVWTHLPHIAPYMVSAITLASELVIVIKSGFYGEGRRVKGEKGK